MAVESLAGTFQVFNSENRHPVRFGRGVARRGALAHPTLLRRRPMLPAVISVRAGKPASASRLTRASARVGLGIVLVALLTLSTASIVSAHAFLASTTPRAGERLLGSPSEVVFQFSEPVMVESDGVAVRTAQGAAIPLGPPESNGRSQLRIPLPPLAPAVYSVSWSVVASDGHHSAGEFAFGVGTEAIEASTAVTSDAPIAWPAAAAGAMLLVGFALGAGGLLSELAVWHAVAREQGVAVPRAPLHAGLVLGAVGAASQFMLAVGGLSRLDLVLTTRPAVLAAIELACLAYTAWISWRPRLRAWTVLLLCMGIVAFLLGGHAGGATQIVNGQLKVATDGPLQVNAGGQSKVLGLAGLCLAVTSFPGLTRVSNRHQWRRDLSAAGRCEITGIRCALATTGAVRHARPSRATARPQAH